MTLFIVVAEKNVNRSYARLVANTLASVRSCYVIRTERAAMFQSYKHPKLLNFKTATGSVAKQVLKFQLFTITFCLFICFSVVVTVMLLNLN